MPTIWECLVKQHFRKLSQQKKIRCCYSMMADEGNSTAFNLQHAWHPSSNFLSKLGLSSITIFKHSHEGYKNLVIIPLPAQFQWEISSCFNSTVRMNKTYLKKIKNQLSFPYRHSYSTSTNQFWISSKFKLPSLAESINLLVIAIVKTKLWKRSRRNESKILVCNLFQFKAHQHAPLEQQ